MAQNVPKDPRFLPALISFLVFLALLTPLLLTDNPKQAVLGALLLVALFFFPGYLPASLSRIPPGGLRIPASWRCIGHVRFLQAYCGL